MGMFEFIIAIVLIGTVSGIVTGGMKLEREKIRAKARGYAEDNDVLQGVVGELHEEVAKLKDRVRVLEKLVTDDDRRLADEIERLRRMDASPRP